MSLKRKASFSNITSPNADRVLAGPFMAMDMDESPRHLNSRTRKRYRNDRPTEEVVYENTLRWLFTAQQQPHQAPTPSFDDDENMNPEPLPSPETLDPRQQTLLKFFRPKQPAFGQSPSGRWNQQATDALPGNGHILQQQALHINTVAASCGSDSNSSSVRGAGTDMDMEMDSGSDQSAPDSKAWAGAPAWM